MNIFSRVKNAVVGVFGGALKKNREKPTVHERRNGSLDFNAERHYIRFRKNNGRPVLGPSFLPPAEQHHVSRQTCRAVLRAIQFHHVTAAAPMASRKDRRRAASLYARLEYRRMMADPTNAVSTTEELAARTLAPSEYAA